MGSMDRDRPGARGDRIEESVWGVPAPPLRPFIAGYAGFRQAGVPPRYAPRAAVSVPHRDLHA